MARTRSVVIREELDELDQLRQFFAGKPEARRILFLLFLKEDPKRTVSEAARKARISARRGRYWWDAYRNGGLQSLLDRRVWKKSELEATSPGVRQSDVDPQDIASSQGVPDGRGWVSFLNAVAANSTEHENVRTWVNGFRAALLPLLGDVDFIAMNVRTGIDVLTVKSGRVQAYLQFGDDQTVKGHRFDRKGDFKHDYESLIESGRKSGFPIHEYQDPPEGFDFFLEPGKRERNGADSDDSLVASLVLLRKKGFPPISQESIDLIERLRPFIVYTVTDYLVRSALWSTKGQEIESLVDRVAGGANLTQQESRVLLLAFMGHTYQEMADSLHVSINTIQTHIRSIYRKTGVSKLGEVYGKFLTPRAFPDEVERDIG